MERARELFERLEIDGLAALERLLAEEEPESLFLDYKRSATLEGDPGLHRNDRENLSKALSGFANSEGGLLIWGVDARREAGGQREVTNKVPVPQAAAFRTLVEGALSGESIPALSNARVLHILEGAGPAGYVAVLIPQSLIGPIRATRTDKYHLRSGSSFGIVPHGVLAGMFGRSPQPIIQPNLVAYFTQLNERRDAISISFAVAAGNFGAVLASKVFLSAWMGDLARLERAVDVQVVHAGAYDLRRGGLPGFTIVAKDGVELAPGGIDELCNIVVTLPATYRQSIRFDFTLGARDAPPVRFYVGINAETMNNLVERLLAARVRTDEIWETDVPLM
ncbi:helix-turn-helix domain-containing protein [Lysobacter enzymogenes]|uniref:AlbA family DNA-binding domain-containing protein n=1 Tax=Lysobacter enzymogenes TaxID=69 RepID=UPI00384F8C0F